MSYQVHLAVTLPDQTRGVTIDQDQDQVRRGVQLQDQAPRTILEDLVTATPTLRGQVMAIPTRPLHGASLRALNLKVVPSIGDTNGTHWGYGGARRLGTSGGTAGAIMIVAVDRLPQLDIRNIHRVLPLPEDTGAHMGNAPRMVALEPTIHRAPPLSKEIAHMSNVLRMVAPDLLDPKIDMEDLIRVVLSLKCLILGLCLEVDVEVLGNPLGVPLWEALGGVLGEGLLLTAFRVLLSNTLRLILNICVTFGLHS